MCPREHPEEKCGENQAQPKAGKIFGSTRCHRYRPTLFVSGAGRDQVAANPEERVDRQGAELSEWIVLESPKPNCVIDGDRAGEDKANKLRLLRLGENDRPMVRNRGWREPSISPRLTSDSSRRLDAGSSWCWVARRVDPGTRDAMAVSSAANRERGDRLTEVVRDPDVDRIGGDSIGTSLPQ